MTLDIASAAVGLIWGVFVGVSAMAIVSVLNIIPRLLQLNDTLSEHNMRVCYLSFAAGCVIASLSSLSGLALGMGDAAAAIVSLVYGVYVGFLISSLTEVLDLVPTLAGGHRTRLIVTGFVLLLAFSKIAGALLELLIMQE